MILELVFEIFIRPDGYHSLIISEKAYSPSTVRYINAFHLTIELMSLGVFVPEFLCLFSPQYGCSDRTPFSFFNAAFLAILGPSSKDAFFGRAYMAIVRLRLFGLVRHWKKMWINDNSNVSNINGKAKGTRNRFLSGVFVPARVGHSDGKKHKSEALNVERQTKKEDALINASNIGRALLVINSHRALLIV